MTLTRPLSLQTVFVIQYPMRISSMAAKMYHMKASCFLKCVIDMGSLSDTIWPFNTLRPRQNGRHFPDDILKWIFLTENVWISIEISLKFVPKGPINNIPALVQIMAWRRSGDKPLSEPMMVNLSDAYMRHSASMSWNKHPLISIKISIKVNISLINVHIKVCLQNINPSWCWKYARTWT